jgi:hypothetical protein
VVAVVAATKASIVSNTIVCHFGTTTFEWNLLSNPTDSEHFASKDY